MAWSLACLASGVDLGMQCRQMRIDGAHHAAGIVAAGRDRVEQNVMQALDRRPQVVLEHPVELEGLPRRQPQRLPP